MPTVSSTPRSAGSSPRGGRLSSTPRSSGSGRSTYRSPLTGAAPRGESGTAFIARQANLHKGAGPAFTPFRAVLDALSVPSYAVGRAIEHPSTLLSTDSGLDIFRDPKKHVTPGQALRKRGALDAIPDKYGLRGIAALTADIALDPTTYISLGGGAALRSGARAAEAAASKEIDDIIRAGGTPTIAQRAKATAAAAKARSEAPKSFKVGVRVPFTRGKDVVLGESEALSAAASKVKDALARKFNGDAWSRGFSASRGVGPAVDEVFQDVRRVGSAEMGRLGKAAKTLDDDIAKVEKKIGLKRGEGASAITRHLDNPERYDLPAGLEDLSGRARSMLDDLNAMEKDAGIEYREVEHYVSHLGATPADSRKIASIYAKPTANTLDEPFFVKPRESKNLDEFEAIGREQGFTPEFNIARIIERRARASVNARQKKALDDAVFDVFGTKTPDVSPDQAFEDWLGLSTSKKYHSADDLPAPIAQDLERVHAQITPLVKDDDAIALTRRFIGGLTSRWKALALLSPGYNIRNLYDDGIRAYWAGARNPASFVQAARIQAGKGGPIKIGGQTWTPDELLRRAEANGVINTGFVRTETESSTELVRRRGAAGPGRGPVVRAGQKVGDFRENNVRLGTWLELMKRGEDPAAAARKVADFLFDYGQVGRFVEEARSFWMPFITFPSKAIPFVAKEFARHPGRAANVNKTINALNQAAGDEDLSLLPAGSQASFGVPFPNGLARKIIGAPDDQTLMVNPERLFAAGSLNLLDPRISRIRQNFLGGLLNPAVRAPLEIATGKSFYLGADLPKLASAPGIVNRLADLGVPIPTYVPAGAPGGKKNFYTGQPVGGYSAYLDTLLRLFPQYGQASTLIPGGGNDTAQLSAARFLFGVPVSPFDRAKALARVQRFGNP